MCLDDIRFMLDVIVSTMIHFVSLFLLASTGNYREILKENENIGELEPIGAIDSIGNTSSSLQSSRFMGNRAYLFTAGESNLLHVINLEDGTNPEIMDELVSDGFAEYLQPLGDSHLLGFGYKNVSITTDSGYTYNKRQGLKISLFDVSSSNSVNEVQSMEIGHSGTNSGLFRDHHTFAFLDAHNNSPARFAIPVNLYDTNPQYSYYDLSDPNYRYDWTHHGLYVFDVNYTDNPGFDLTGKLITAEAISDYYYIGPSYGNSVIQGDSVHYFYNHELYSSAIADLEK